MSCAAHSSSVRMVPAPVDPSNASEREGASERTMVYRALMRKRVSVRERKRTRAVKEAVRRCSAGASSAPWESAWNNTCEQHYGKICCREILRKIKEFRMLILIKPAIGFLGRHLVEIFY